MWFSEQILFVIVFGSLYYCTTFNDNFNQVENYKRGFFGVILFFAAQSIIKPFDGKFQRPNKGLWRGVKSLTLIYLLGLVFLTFQKPNDGRAVLQHLDSNLGKPVTKDMHTYDDDCEFGFEQLWDNVDHYFAMHVYGFFMTTLMARNCWVNHIWSVLIEITELSWQHKLPHFRECWWDHILGDMLSSNNIGIILGYLFILYFKLDKFDWFGVNNKKSIVQWDVFNCHRRFITMVFIFTGIMVNFLCAFFLINALWVPPKSPVNLFRVFVWQILGNYVFSEIWNDLNTTDVKEREKLQITGQMRWNSCGVIFCEILLCLRYSQDAGNITDAPWPDYVVYPWITFYSVLFLFYINLRFRTNNTQIKLKQR